MSGRDFVVVPLSFAQACAFIASHHRHHQPPQGHKLSIGLLDRSGRQVGVAVIGRPVARCYDNGHILEVTRVATDGTPNSCSALYGAAWRIVRNWGYRRLTTYTHTTESGVSLRAAGWRKVAERAARTGWDGPSRPRHNRGSDNTARVLWEITTDCAEPLPIWHNETRNETGRGRRPRCPVCRDHITTARTGRPAHYCSNACRQKAHRDRVARNTP